MAHLLSLKAATINVAVLKFDEFWDFEYNIIRKMRSLSIVLLFDDINFNKRPTAILLYSGFVYQKSRLLFLKNDFKMTIK